MTDPQLPPSAPHGPAFNGTVPPVPPAPGYIPAPAPAPGYQAPAPAPAPGYQAPAAAAGYPTPPGAYAAPVGGYSAPMGNYQAPEATQPKSAVLGIIALVLSLVAAVVTPIFAGISGYQIGFALPSVMQQVDSSANDLSFLAPVREQVLLGEIGFWIGTIAGITAIVLGIMAIAKRQGRGPGIAALILSVLAPMIFFIVLFIALSAGAGTGAVSLYGS